MLDILTRTKEFTLLPYYDVVIGQRTASDIKNTVINSFITTVLLV